MATLWRPKGQQFFDNSGNPLNGGKFRFYDAGTLSAKTVYQDADEDVPWSQPITLDSAGRLTEAVYVTSGAFKENLKTSADVDLWTADEIPGSTVLTVSEFARPNMPVISKSVSYTVLEDDIGSMIQADATGGDVTITLISAVSAGNGAQIGVQNVGTAGTVTVTVPGAQTINGATSIKLLKPRSGGVFTSNAGAWSGPVTAAPYTTLSKTTTYTVGVEDVGRTIKADASGGAWTATLPAAADAGDGFEVTIIKTDSGTNLVTIDGDGSETINGATTVTLSLQYHSVTVRCDGSNWQIVKTALEPPFQSATDNTIVRADATRGKLQTTGVTIDDSNNLSTGGTLTSTATSANQIPVGTTAQRPSGSAGMVRWNSTLSRFEGYTGSAWTGLTGWDFTSSELALTDGTTHEVAHGLGVIPSRMRIALRCKTADTGWAVGDEIQIASWSWRAPGDGTGAVTVGANATNIYVGLDLSSSAGQIDIANRAGGTGAALTLGSWRFVVYASL